MSDPESDGLLDAADVPDWSPSSNWEPEFEDELKPEEYDGN